MKHPSKVAGNETDSSTLPRASTTQAAILERLRTLGHQWRVQQQKIGKALLALERTGYPVDLVIRNVLNRECGMGIDEAWCCLRWAKGEFGSHGAALMARVGNKTVLKSIPKESLLECIAKPKTIQSRHEKRVVSKRLLEMTPEEISDHLTPRGVRRQRRKIVARQHTYTAQEYEISGGRFVIKGGPHCSVRMALTRDIYDAARRHFEATAEVA